MALDLGVDDDVTLVPAIRKKLATEVARMVRAAARTAGQPGFEVALRLTTDAGIQALNRAYRGKNKPTDVLAFAQREGPAAALHPELLGDLVISVETARRQARRGLHAELLHLASHGLCHLLGYDHRDDAEERAMNARAAKLRTEARRRGPIRAA
ncbi:MAG: rRNA maturation RNase YbeY [Deltaproteobacteria bacterium]|nr:rRNA maturation RNase YbeY [Deltaproteobacteria bacterium]MDQ3299027.1 rRNA maturation RNase YbeY [Myxococcota bacterium]